MKRLHTLLAVAGVAALVLAGCPGVGVDTGTDTGTGGNGGDPSPDDGTVTVSLSGAMGEENHLWAWLYRAGEWNLDDPQTVVAAGSQQIEDGSASFVLKNSDGSYGYTADEWVGTGGAAYDLYVMIMGESGEPLPEGMKTTADLPMSITIDGDRDVDLAYDAMVDYVPTTGTLTVTLSGAAAQNGKLLAVGIWDEGDGPWANPPIDGTLQAETIAAGTATVHIDTTDTDMDAATPYDVFIFIFMEVKEGPPEPGTDLLYKNAPVAWWVDGDRTMLPEYDDFGVIPLPPLE